jgi:hypothetical protein
MTKSFLSTVLITGLMSAQTVFATVPTLAMTFDTNVSPIGTTSSQESKIQAAETKIKDVVGSEEFRSAVLNHTYGGKKTFVDNKGLTNAQIYQKILDGAETLQPKKNNVMDISVKLYYQNSIVVGYTTTASKTINMNTKYFNTYTSSGVSHNMMHEWLHKLGFTHAASYSVSRNYSVPYAIGNIMGKLALKY